LPRKTLWEVTLVPMPVVMPAHQPPPLVMPTTSDLPSPLTSATITSCQPALGFHLLRKTFWKVTLLPVPTEIPAHQPPPLVMPTPSDWPSPLTSATITSCTRRSSDLLPRKTLWKVTLVPMPAVIPAHQPPPLVMPTTSDLPSPLTSATITSRQP